MFVARGWRNYNIHTKPFCVGHCLDSVVSIIMKHPLLQFSFRQLPANQEVHFFKFSGPVRTDCNFTIFFVPWLSCVRQLCVHTVSLLSCGRITSSGFCNYKPAGESGDKQWLLCTLHSALYFPISVPVLICLSWWHEWLLSIVVQENIGGSNCPRICIGLKLPRVYAGLK